MAEVEPVSVDVPLFEYKFAVDLREISLENNDPFECTIKFSYDLFGPEEVQYPTFTIPSDTKSQDIPGHFEFTISRRKEEDVKQFLNENFLQVHVYNKEILAGIADVDLGPLFTNKAQKMLFGLKHNAKTIITNKNSDEKTNIGFIYGVFFLEKEECFSCKACGKNLKVSTVFKHLGHPKNDCGKSYQMDELKTFRTKSDKRRREKQHQRIRMTYDPEKRAKLHKKAYNSTERAKLYQKEKEASKQIISEIEKNNWKSIGKAWDYGVTWGPGVETQSD